MDYTDFFGKLSVQPFVDEYRFFLFSVKSVKSVV